MTREIKFRAWRKEKKRMMQVDEISIFFGHVSWIDHSAMKVKGVPYSEVEIMQYTGLNDRNGKEIYEGDIIQDESGIGEVEWVQEHCSYLVFTKNPSTYNRLESDGQLLKTEVIGNIHEHPHLLEGGEPA